MKIGKFATLCVQQGHLREYFLRCQVVRSLIRSFCSLAAITVLFDGARSMCFLCMLDPLKPFIGRSPFLALLPASGLPHV